MELLIPGYCTGGLGAIEFSWDGGMEMTFPGWCVGERWGGAIGLGWDGGRAERFIWGGGF